MSTPKPNAVLAANLVQQLASCRAAGGPYPVLLSDLATRLDPPADLPAVLKAVETKDFKDKAAVAVRGRADAPAALAEDASALAASLLTLEAALRAVGETGGPARSLSELAKALPKALQPGFKAGFRDLPTAGELPPFVVLVRGKGRAAAFHHRDHPPPPPPEEQDAERLVELLRRQTAPGGAVSFEQLRAGAGLNKTAFNKAVKQPAFAAEAMPMRWGDAFLLPTAGEFGRFVAGALLPQLLTRLQRANAHAFTVKELVGPLADKGQQRVVAGLLGGPALDLPLDVGCVLVGAGRSGGQHAYFRLEHLRRAQPAMSAAPADFATAFDAAFARLDRERGSNNFVSLVDLRAALPHVPRGAFDAALQQFRRDRRYRLSSDERYDGISPEQQAAAIREEGEFLLHVSRSRQ